MDNKMLPYISLITLLLSTSCTETPTSPQPLTLMVRCRVDAKKDCKESLDLSCEGEYTITKEVEEQIPSLPFKTYYMEALCQKKN